MLQYSKYWKMGVGTECMLNPFCCKMLWTLVVCPLKSESYFTVLLEVYAQPPTPPALLLTSAHLNRDNERVQF